MWRSAPQRWSNAASGKAPPTAAARSARALEDRSPPLRSPPPCPYRWRPPPGCWAARGAALAWGVAADAQALNHQPRQARCAGARLGGRRGPAAGRCRGRMCAAADHLRPLAGGRLGACAADLASGLRPGHQRRRLARPGLDRARRPRRLGMGPAGVATHRHGAKGAPMTAITPEPAVAAAVAADAWLRRFREILIGVLGGTVAAIGALAFYTSFEAIKQYANGSGGIAPEHDWAIPLLVDSFIVVATGADVWFATTGHRRRLWEIWWPKALLAGAAGVSFALNVAHATSDKWTARGVAAIPPAALVLGVELLMMVLRRATALRTERLAAAQAEAEAAALAVTLERSTPTGRNRPELPARTRNRAAGSARNHRGGPPRADQATTAQAEPHGHNPPDGAAGAEPSSRHAQAVAWVLAERAAGRTP